MSAMVVLAGPAAAASAGRALLGEDAGAGAGAAPPTPGQVLIPGIHDDYGSLITAMLANQGGMIGDMASALHPALANPLASLANMMTIVQTSLPDLLAGAGLPFEPSPLVHEMFVKYSNGTKTEADLAMIDKGLDELFSHEFTEGDKEKLVDFMDMKDAFSKVPLPGKNLTLPSKTPKAWPTINVRYGFFYEIQREREMAEKRRRVFWWRPRARARPWPPPPPVHLPSAPRATPRTSPDAAAAAARGGARTHHSLTPPPPLPSPLFFRLLPSPHSPRTWSTWTSRSTSPSSRTSRTTSWTTRRPRS